MNVALSRTLFASANLDAASFFRAPRSSELLMASASLASASGEALITAEAFVAFVAFEMLNRADAGGSIGREWTGPGVTK